MIAKVQYIKLALCACGRIPVMSTVAREYIYLECPVCHVDACEPTLSEAIKDWNHAVTTV